MKRNQKNDCGSVVLTSPSLLSKLPLSVSESGYWSKFWCDLGDHPSFNGEPANCMDDLLPL